MIRCFFLEPTGLAQIALRRYSRLTYVDDPARPGHVIYTNQEARRCPAMPGENSYHNASVVIGTAPEPWDAEHGHWSAESIPSVERLIFDPRWPKTCQCGHVFCDCRQVECPNEHYQVFAAHVYRRADTGEEMTLQDAPAGAMWYADWAIAQWKDWDPAKPHWVNPGPDGHVLQVKTPGGDWVVDSRASNCTMPEDNEHRCWVRHGTPPDVTVDKNGLTCAAGAGSISAGNYHGFLQGGQLT